MAGMRLGGRVAFERGSPSGAEDGESQTAADTFMSKPDSDDLMVSEIPSDSRLLLGRNHWPHGKTGFRVDYVLGEYWTEVGTTRCEHQAKFLAQALLKEGKTVRISKTFECMEVGEAITP